MSRVETKQLQSNLKIQLKLLNDGEVVLDATRRGKTKVLKILQGSLELKWDVGYVKTTYNYREGFYNHAEFRTRGELEALLTEFLDPYLVRTYLTAKA